MKKVGVIIGLILLIAAALVAWQFKNALTGESVIANKVIYITSNDNYSDVISKLENCNCIKSLSHFQKIAELKKYPELVKPGRYELKNGMSNEQVINKLRIGEQDPVQVTFNNVRTIDELSGKIAQYFEADSSTFSQYLINPEVRLKYGFTKEEFPAMFIPNTYLYNWNTTPEEFCSRMAVEFKKFWNDSRKTKASSLGLSQSEVVTLAAIVEEETKKNDEKPKVAGVYLNRIRRGMLLQADPTVVFAANDFTIRRVLNKHKNIDSPYNTYMYKGLPPGPIRFPEIYSPYSAVFEI
ncbi:MAG: endolytic transglycosylase MltG, partial [Salibacteraceae bacterium]